MNIFQKIKIFNKVTKIIKEVKDYFAKTHIDDDMKIIIRDIKTDFERLIKKAPELKEAYLYILGLMK